jgi:hypothetical protein
MISVPLTQQQRARIVDAFAGATDAVGALDLSAPAPIVAISDPFCLYGGGGTRYRRGPFSLPAGRYTVTLAIATLHEWGRRVAYALLAPAGAYASTVVSWRVVDTLAVDSGTAAFATDEATDAWIAVTQRDPAHGLAAIEACARVETPEHPWLAYALTPGDSPEESLLLCSTGIGDGHYPILEGLDERNDRVALLIDFLL